VGQTLELSSTAGTLVNLRRSHGTTVEPVVAYRVKRTFLMGAYRHELNGRFMPN